MFNQLSKMIIKEAKLFTSIIYKFVYTKCLYGITDPIVDLNQRVSCNCLIIKRGKQSRKNRTFVMYRYANG